MFKKSNVEIVPGIEDRLYYEIWDECIRCGACARACPAQAIRPGEGDQDPYVIDPDKCIDCGTCSYKCPVGAAKPIAAKRYGLDPKKLDPAQCYFDAGCAMFEYRPELPAKLQRMIQEVYGDIQLYSGYCRHEPELPENSVIINSCAGCDRRFRSLYEGIRTITLWELLDQMEGLTLPDHAGMTVTIHDSCGYRHRPGVHAAIRNLLRKMNINIVESKFSGSRSVCCGDSLYGIQANEEVEARIRERAEQLPEEQVVVTCIGCVRAFSSAGKRPLYLPDLLCGTVTEPIMDTLDEYHSRLLSCIADH